MTLRKKLLAFLWAKPSSAKWLTEVEWLHNDYDEATNAVPYIDTGIFPSWNIPFEMSATITKTSANRTLILSNFANQLTFYIEITATNRIRFGSQDSTTSDPTFVAFDAYTNSSYPIPLNKPTRIWVKYNPRNDAAHTVDYEIGLDVLDGSGTTTSTIGTCYRSGSPSSNTRTLRMFYDYRSPSSSFDGGFKLHQCEIKMGTVHKKFIPCIDLNRIPCMYEQVEGKLYYNAGTGGFNVGRRIIEVEWMHLTGKQYFNTKFKPNTLNTTLRTKYTFEGTAMMLGCRNHATYPQMCSIYMPVATTSRPYSRIRLDWMAGTTGLFSNYLDSEVVELEITGNYAKVNGVEYTDTTKTSLDIDSPFYIGCAYSDSTTAHYTYPQTGKVYFVELLQTYTRESHRYCVPAHDENNVGFFFDRVNHFIMDNEGTGTEELTWGDEIHPVSYLYGGAPSRFDVGIIFYGHKWETDVRYNTVRNDINLMGVTTGACNYWGVLSNTSSQYGQYSLHTSNAEFGLNIDPAETRTVFLDSYRNNANTYDMLSMTVEGQSVTRSTSEANRTTGYRIPDFQNGYPEPAYIYGNRCYDGTTNELLQNLITVQSGQKGSFLFDTLTHTLINPISSIDTFTKGNDVIGYPIEPQLPYGLVEVDYLESTGTQYLDNLNIDTKQARLKTYDENGRIVSDYIPCLRTYDNKPGMFDLITRQFLTNQGTGEFIIGIDGVGYTPADYLESTGTQWIDVGIPMQGKYGVEIEAKQTSATTGVGRYLFGDAPASTGRYLIVVTSGGNTYRLGLDTLNKDSDVSAYDGKYHVHKVENKTYFIDGVSQGSLNAPDFTCNRNARLFSVATTSTLSDNTWQIKRCTIKDENNNKLANFVPLVRTSDNKPGMFDLVSRTLCVNGAGGTDFTVGTR